jgi:hypothetical protein
MPAQTDLDRLSVDAFTGRCQGAMIPASNRFSYFAASPLNEEEVKDYVEDPVASLPPALVGGLPLVCIALVPYLERPNGKGKEVKPVGVVCFERPAEKRQAPFIVVHSGQQATLLFAIKDRPVADYHYHFYNAIAGLAVDQAGDEPRGRFWSLLREELHARVHGEVDQEGWHLKQSLMRRQTNLRRETKTFQEYARQACIDTLTLYLHGICCDIDVEPGPRQLPSRYLRKRLVVLEELYPPPEGYVVFPEDAAKG